MPEVYYTIGEFKKLHRDDMLSGYLTINGKKIDCVAFLKTKEQKRDKFSPDVIIRTRDEIAKPIEIPKDLF